MSQLPHSEKAVYTHSNRVNGKLYVGKTECSVEERWADHCRNAKRQHSPWPFQRAIRKYGPESFEVAGYISLGESFCECKTEKEILKALNDLETLLIARLDTNNKEKGYNVTSGGDGVRLQGAALQRRNAAIRAAGLVAQNRPEVKAKKTAAIQEAYAQRPEVMEHLLEATAQPGYLERRNASIRNAHARPEVKAKHAQATREALARPEVKAKHKAAMNRPDVLAKLQRPKSPETRAKCSAAQKGKKLSPENRAKAISYLCTPENQAKSKAAMGRPEVRAKLSEAAKLRNQDPSYVAKCSAAQKGKKRSPESRAKQSAAWARKREEKLAAQQAPPLFTAA
jgi:hypothetical protein